MSRYHQGIFKPKNPQKYRGNPLNIVYRSSWELRYMMGLDTDPKVVSWASEEQSIAYRNPLDGKLHRYFIDFIFDYNEGEKIQRYAVEIKPEEQTIPPKPKKNQKKFLKESMEYAKNTRKWEAAQSWCKNRGIIFKIITEKHLGISNGSK